MDIKERLNTVLNKYGWTRYKLSKESGLLESTISNIFYRGTIPTLTTLETICKTMNISLADFFAEDERIEVDLETREFLAALNKLPAEKRKHILQTMKYME